MERTGHFNDSFSLWKLHTFHTFHSFREWKQTKKYYSSSARAFERTQNWGWCSVLHFAERALQSDGDATSVLLCKVNADAGFDLDIQSYVKTFKSELVTEILQKPCDCSVSLKQPQLSASLRSIPKKHSTLTQHVLSLCALNRLPFTCWSATCQLGHLKCLQASVAFVSVPFVQSQAEWSQPGGFEHQFATGRYSWRESWQQPPQAAPLKSALSYFAEFTPSIRGHSHVHKVWETSDAVYVNTWLTTGWREEAENLSKTTKQEWREVLPSLAVIGRKVQYFSREFLGVSFAELLLSPWYSFLLTPMHQHGAWHWVHSVSALNQQLVFVSAPHKFPPCFRQLEGEHKVLLVPQAPAQHPESLCYFCHRGELPSTVPPRASPLELSNPFSPL